jgi:hypothetical protein
MPTGTRARPAPYGFYAVTTDLRRIEPPRPVEVLHDGQSVIGAQDTWVRWPHGERRRTR